MPTNFPASLDAYSNPSGSGTLAAEGHSTHHANHNDAIEALEAKVGVDDSAVSTSLDFLLKGILGVFTKGELALTGATTATIGRMHVCSGTTADYTVTLPAADGNAGKLIGLRMSGALTKLVTIDGNAAELIDGQATRVMWAGESAILLCDGTGWAKVAGQTIPLTGALSAAGVTIPSTTVTTILDRFTCTRPGRYQVDVRVEWSTSPASDNTQARIDRNGSFSGINAGGPHPAGYPMTTITYPFALVVGDYLQLSVYQTSGFDMTVASAQLNVTEVPTW